MLQGGADPGGVVSRVETGEDCPYGKDFIPRTILVFPVEIKSVVRDARAVFSSLVVHQSPINITEYEPTLTKCSF
jgi:hypothetical protein